MARRHSLASGNLSLQAAGLSLLQLLTGVPIERFLRAPQSPREGIAANFGARRPTCAYYLSWMWGYVHQWQDHRSSITVTKTSDDTFLSVNWPNPRYKHVPVKQAYPPRGYSCAAGPGRAGTHSPHRSMADILRKAGRCWGWLQVTEYCWCWNPCWSDCVHLWALGIGEGRLLPATTQALVSAPNNPYQAIAFKSIRPSPGLVHS